MPDMLREEREEKRREEKRVGRESRES